MSEEFRLYLVKTLYLNSKKYLCLNVKSVTIRV